jgi:hypothetical protein
LPCGHITVCNQCSPRVKKCLICKEFVDDRKKVTSSLITRFKKGKVVDPTQGRTQSLIQTITEIYSIEKVYINTVIGSTRRGVQALSGRDAEGHLQGIGAVIEKIGY